ncbi:MAG: EamA family transporter RarD [Actinomycetes bacterium]
MTIDPVQRRRGTAFAITAYALWGLFPLYWPLLEPASPWEILANRVWWSFVFLAAVAWVRKGWPQVAAVARNRRSAVLLAAAALLVTINWGLYIWAVNNHQVVESALGYFINPLVSVALGMIVLKERLNRLQWVAISIATAAVAVLAVDYGRLPWIALVLASSFGSYGLLKKMAGVDAFASLTFETSVLAPISLSAMVFLQLTHHSTLIHHGGVHVLLLVLTGAITAIPLLFFGAGAGRVPLTTMGVLQYIAPIIQFTLGVTVIGEAMPTSRWFGFGAVWLALIVFGVDAYRRAQAVRSTT